MFEPKPNSNLRKVLAAIWRNQPEPVSYQELIESFKYDFTEKQIYNSVQTLKLFGYVIIEGTRHYKQISINDKKSRVIQNLLIEGELI